MMNRERITSYRLCRGLSSQYLPPFIQSAQSAATCSRWFLACEFFYPEDGGDTFLRNVGSHKIYTAPHLRRRHSSYSPLRKPKKLHNNKKLHNFGGYMWINFLCNMGAPAPIFLVFQGHFGSMFLTAVTIWSRNLWVRCPPTFRRNILPPPSARCLLIALSCVAFSEVGEDISSEKSV
jgi:hypothetical protein